MTKPKHRRRPRVRYESEANPAMTWDDVAELWNRMSGQHLTRARVMQIGNGATAKLRAALEGWR